MDMNRRSFLGAAAATTLAAPQAFAAATDKFGTPSDPILKTSGDGASQEINVILSNGREPDLVQIVELGKDGTRRIAYIEVADVNGEKRTAVHMMTQNAAGDNARFSEFQHSEREVTPPPPQATMPMASLGVASPKNRKQPPTPPTPQSQATPPQPEKQTKFSLKFPNWADVNGRQIAPEITEPNSAWFNQGLHSRTVSETYRVSLGLVELARQAVAEKRASPEPKNPEYTTIFKISGDTTPVRNSNGTYGARTQLKYDTFIGVRWDKGLVGQFKLIPSGSSSTPDLLSGTFGPYEVNARGKFIDIGLFSDRNDVRIDRIDLKRIDDPNQTITVENIRGGDPTITIVRQGMPTIRGKLSAIRDGANSNTSYAHSDVRYAVAVTGMLIPMIPEMAQNVLDHPAKPFAKEADPFRMKTQPTKVSAASPATPTTRLAARGQAMTAG